MAALFEARFNRDDAPYSADGLVAALAGREVLVSSITDRIDADLIARLPETVKLIAQFGNGFDNIDIEAAYAAGLTVTNTPSVLTEDTADMAMMLMLALPRRLVEGAEVLPRDGTWPGWSPTWMLGRRLRGKALGIVGMGRIGSAVAARAKTFGLTIHYFSRNRRPPALEDKLDAQFHESLDEMAEAVEILSLHTPLTRDTHHILSRERIGRMRPEAFVVNVSRSELIDEDALVEAISAGRLSGAALDVFENRHGISEKLLDLARAHKIVLTAHMASATLEARIEMGETVIVNIRAFIDGHQPPHRVLPETRARA
ncbi:MAG: D-glycerate dehydrogenase [Devosia nanyangense]|uniref:D-glycerate dehydrogenase n=1 Tax=Devosia nanyangense TaxID=1228055 RepID=A0A933L2P6_9HYPH|nr:D-glycerate dehydrogenase [Devosia nanyangense]